MPKLEGLSLRYALDKLEKNHLKLQDTIYRPDFMKGSVLEQQYQFSKNKCRQQSAMGKQDNIDNRRRPAGRAGAGS